MSALKLDGTFTWHELLTSDSPAAAKFYAKAVGWKSEPWAQSADYTLFTANGQMAGGLMKLPDDICARGVGPNWTSYIGTSSVDVTLAETLRLGGTVVKSPMDIPNVGRVAILADPQGGCFGVFTPANRPPPGYEAIEHFNWHELATSDLDSAMKFYGELFGWKEMRRMPMGPDMTYLIFGWDGTQRGGMYRKHAGQPGPAAYWLPYAFVGSAAQAAKLVTAAGGKIMNGPMQVPGGGWIVQGLDPQGAFFALHSPPEVVAAPKKKKAASKVKAKAKAKVKVKVKVKAKAKLRPKKKAKSKAKQKPKAKPKKSVRRKRARR